MRVAPAGDRAVLVELGEVSAEELHAYARKVREAGFAVVVGHSSVLAVEDRQSFLSGQARSPVLHRIPVVFDGAEVGLLPRDFMHRIPPLTARYLGFRGGFAYLDGWPEEWSLPRRSTSRPVLRGTFAVAGNVAGFYPIDSPGGWNLLGRTNVNLENAIAPGDVIVIEPVEQLEFAPPQPAPRLELASAEILAAPLAVRVDEHSAFDDVAALIASRAVGGAAEMLECALAGPRLRFRRDCVIAWCTPDLDVCVERIRAGDERAFGRIAGGLRAYLAIGEREGVIAKLERGDRHVIDAYRGPHESAIGDVECEVTPRLDRVGIRLRPLHPLRLHVPADLRSIGMQCGTVQVHPDGSLVAMGPDHPVTGGYLQPMTVISSERWKLAQLVPGERVLFRVTNRTDIPRVP